MGTSVRLSRFRSGERLTSEGISRVKIPNIASMNIVQERGHGRGHGRGYGKSRGREKTLLHEGIGPSTTEIQILCSKTPIY